MAASRNKAAAEPALLACLRQRLTEDIPPRVPLYVGLSGGRDSMALADALAGMCPPERLAFIHVHHGLSPDAEAWAQRCAEFAQVRGVRLILHRVQVDPHSGKGLEAAARAARWQIFRQEVVAEGVLALAHHQGDQAETVLFRALRGTGITGLAGMARYSRSMGVPVWRPWLDQSREDITRYAQDRALHWVEDASNADQHYSRNFLRQTVFPLLRARFPSLGVTLGRLAEQAAEAHGLLAERAMEDLHELRVVDQPDALVLAGLCRLSAARQRNAVRYWLGEAGWPFPETRTLLAWQAQWQVARPDSQARLSYPGGVCRVVRGYLLRENSSPAVRAGEGIEL